MHVQWSMAARAQTCARPSDSNLKVQRAEHAFVSQKEGTAWQIQAGLRASSLPVRSVWSPGRCICTEDDCEQALDARQTNLRSTYCSTVVTKTQGDPHNNVKLGVVAASTCVVRSRTGDGIGYLVSSEGLHASPTSGMMLGTPTY